MLTPQDIQKVSFDRALVGGYNTQQVDEFLQPLSEDYITLYQENIVLKNKLKVVVESLREYQVRESSMEAANARARREVEQLRASTQAQCDQMLAEAETSARAKLSELLDALHAEQLRVDTARRAAADFIALMEKTVAEQLTTLSLLKSMSADELEQPDSARNPTPLSAENTVRISRAARTLRQQVEEQPDDNLRAAQS